VDLPLINLRRPYEFRVFRWDKSEISNRTPVDEDHNPLPSTTHLLARSDGVSFRNLNDPAQLHLAFTSNQDEMRVMFLTRDAIKSSVRYGLDENEMDSVVEARSVTYTRSEMCDAPANTHLGWRYPGYIHDAVMQGLEPGKRYFYQVFLLIQFNTFIFIFCYSTSTGPLNPCQIFLLPILQIAEVSNMGTQDILSQASQAQGAYHTMVLDGFCWCLISPVKS